MSFARNEGAAEQFVAAEAKTNSQITRKTSVAALPMTTSIDSAVLRRYRPAECYPQQAFEVT
jgi:hypothetical protein